MLGLRTVLDCRASCRGCPALPGRLTKQSSSPAPISHTHSILWFEKIGWIRPFLSKNQGKTASAIRNWKNYAPQTDVTTFALSSTVILSFFYVYTVQVKKTTIIDNTFIMCRTVGEHGQERPVRQQQNFGHDRHVLSSTRQRPLVHHAEVSLHLQQVYRHR